MHTGPASNRIAIVTAGGPNPRIMINALAARFGGVTVLREQSESKKLFLKRRMKKLGFLQTAGQFATMVLSKTGKRFAVTRANEICREYGVSMHEDPSIPLIDIQSINDPDAIATLKSLNPDIVFLISCRMLKAATLAAIPCPVINFHAGINPRYRGLMGGYWALVSNDPDNFGATVHLVDAGVDTGDILYQSRMKPCEADTMLTYPLLQTAASTDIAIRAIEDVLSGTAAPHKAEGPSRQWYHPPVWTWLWNGVFRGIW